MKAPSRVENFSGGYYLVNDTEVVPHSGDRVIARRELVKELTRHVKTPILRLGDSHFAPDIERSVPSETVAVPSDFGYDDDAPLLLAKDGRALEIMLSGGEEPSKRP